MNRYFPFEKIPFEKSGKSSDLENIFKKYYIYLVFSSEREMISIDLKRKAFLKILKARY